VSFGLYRLDQGWLSRQRLKLQIRHEQKHAFAVTLLSICWLAHALSSYLPSYDFVNIQWLDGFVQCYERGESVGDRTVRLFSRIGSERDWRQARITYALPF